MSSQLSYKILQSPDAARWPQGSTFSLKEAAEIAGAKVWEMSVRSRQAPEFDRSGFRFQVIWA